MKFAKELEQELVPEWRAKYLDYKLAKKKLTAVGRAIRNVNQTPRSIRRRGPNLFMPTPSSKAPTYSFLNRPHGYHSNEIADEEVQGSRSAALPSNINSTAEEEATGAQDALRSSSPESNNIPETTPLFRQDRSHSAMSIRENGGMSRYGSIIGSPPNMGATERVPTLNLPDPALEPDLPQDIERRRRHSISRLGRKIRGKDNVLVDNPGSAYEAGKTRHPSKASTGLAVRHRSIFRPKRVNSMPDTEGPRPLLKRLLSVGARRGPAKSLGDTDVPLEAYREVDIRQAEFFMFLDMELEKIEDFYKQKEDDSTKRLQVLRQQLHIMRDRRLEDVINHQTAKMKPDHANGMHLSIPNGGPGHSAPEAKQISMLNPLDGALLAVKEAVKTGRFGKSTKAMTELGTPSSLSPEDPDARRDYTRRPVSPSVPYRLAKRRLKVALQEFYRGLELLKSYTLLNRTAFRKINKKYDKTVNARPSGRYMMEKVNHAWFVKSDVLDSHMRVIEDLYARYFEQGNHKVAVGKLRSKLARPGDYTGNAFHNGLMLATGLVLGIEGVVCGAKSLFSLDPVLKLHTSYLLQLYGGYALMLLLMLMFCIDCKIWSEEKINYPFIFEFDTRHYLDWRQLSEFPCFLALLLGLTMWLNFRQIGGDVMYRYYPVILIGVSVLILLFPLPYLYHRTRKWFLYSYWRLFFAGLYPVEFRDFFLGDMLCSLTYSFGNLEVFFCLYAHNWNNPAQCNSSNSHLFGFFGALPPIWRLLQCLRRYYDTRDIFPHLVNGGKYSFNILTAMSLSLWRIQIGDGGTLHLKTMYIIFATINGIYTSIWDVIMDFSLGDPSAPHPFLRENLGLKQTWFYYLMIVLDPMLRFNWIFYPIYIAYPQHSSLMAFGVALAEVCRRGLWSILRVENEHSTNVTRFRASRDVPLPYDVTDGSQEEQQQERESSNQAYFPPAQLSDSATWPGSTEPTQQATGEDLERAQSGGSSLRLRSRSATERAMAPRGFFSRVGDLLRMAHAMDFERKRKPAVAGTDTVRGHEEEGGTSEEEDADGEGVEENIADGYVDETGRDTDNVINAEALLERARNREM